MFSCISILKPCRCFLVVKKQPLVLFLFLLLLELLRLCGLAHLPGSFFQMGVAEVKLELCLHPLA
jgi:hypothetical protein